MTKLKYFLAGGLIYCAYILVALAVSPVSGGNGAAITGTPSANQIATWASATSIQGVTTGTGVVTALGINVGANGAFGRVIASGTSAMGTSAISSGACATVVTTTATGTLSTDAITWTPNADISGVTGYAPVTTGALIIYPYPTADNVNWKVCNPSGSSITPGAITLNWRVVR